MALFPTTCDASHLTVFLFFYALGDGSVVESCRSTLSRATSAEQSFHDATSATQMLLLLLLLHEHQETGLFLRSTSITVRMTPQSPLNFQTFPTVFLVFSDVSLSLTSGIMVSRMLTARRGAGSHLCKDQCERVAVHDGGLPCAVAECLSWTTHPRTKRRQRSSGTKARGMARHTHKTRHAKHNTKTATFHHPAGLGRVCFQSACSPSLNPLDTWAWEAIKREMFAGRNRISP